jgi:hypothetical protein
VLISKPRREEVVVAERGEECGGHGEERPDLHAPPVPGPDNPGEVGVGHERRGRRAVEAVQQALEGRLHLGGDGVEEARVVGGAAVLGGDDIGDGAQADAVRWCRGGGEEQAEPLLGDDEAHLGAARGEEAAQVHHGVHVAAPGERHRHNVAAAPARLLRGSGGGGGRGHFSRCLLCMALRRASWAFGSLCVSDSDVAPAHVIAFTVLFKPVSPVFVKTSSPFAGKKSNSNWFHRFL